MHSETYLTTRRVSIISGSVNTTCTRKVLISYIALSSTDHRRYSLINRCHQWQLVVFAAKASIQAPDEEHYGHHRIETIAVIVIALILLLVGLSFLYLHSTNWSADRLHPIAICLTDGCNLTSNEVLFHYCLRQGKKIGSSLLISNAWHNRSDALISLIVIVIDWRLYWVALDAICSINHLMIVSMCQSNVWKSVDELIDAATDPETMKPFNTTVNKLGVIAVHIWAAIMATVFLFDVHVQVDGLISVSEGHYIADTAERQ